MGFWSAKLPIRLSWRELGYYFNVPWLFHFTKLVHLFGGAGGCGYNIRILELVGVHGCIVWLELTLIYIIIASTFHAYVVLYSSYLVYSKWHMYFISYACMYALFCMSMYESFLNVVIGLTITLDCYLTRFPACDVSSLVCPLHVQVLLQVAKGCTHLNQLVLEPLMHLPWLTAAVTPLLPTELSYLPLCEIAVKALPYDQLLGLLHQMVWGLIGNSYRGNPLDMLEVPAMSTFLALEGGPAYNLCPLI